MNQIHKLIIFIFLFSYIFSFTVTKIEPKSAILGENFECYITVKDFDDDSYNPNFFELKNYDNYMYLPCQNQNNGLYKCNGNIKENYLYNLTLTLYVNGINTGLTVDIKIPSEIKLLNFYGESFYNYGISELKFKVNFNKLYD